MLICNRSAWRIHFQFNNEKSTYMKVSNNERKQIKIIKAKSDGIFMKPKNNKSSMNYFFFFRTRGTFLYHPTQYL